MTLHVESLVTEAVTDDEAGPGGTGGERPSPQWEQLAMLRRLQSRALLDDLRVSAFGMED